MVGNAEVLARLKEFVADRDWSQFHTPSNLAKGVCIEAAELLECFQWSEDYDESRVREELADVLTYAFLLAQKIGADPGELILEKLSETGRKYPVEKARGRSDKYDQI